MRVLVTGGAGFVGSAVSLGLKARSPDWDVVALDNLHRAGSELNLPRLAAAGVEFAEGDVRKPAALQSLPRIDALIECSAEPSALAGFDGSPDYVVHTNLTGAYNCLELARRDDAAMIFLSTSRVYPIAKLEALAVDEAETRLELSDEQDIPGATSAGIAEDFPLDGARTLYGTTKLAAELLIAEYAYAFGLRAVVDRFGVIAGPWQMGKIDQGVFTYWMLAHHFEKPLRYIGFGGAGKQVRDLLHVDDAVELIALQLNDLDHWAGRTVNAGGGRECSLSLIETTELCRELTGNEVPIASDPETRPGDVPVYISDCRRLHGLTDWRPARDARTILGDIHDFVAANANKIAPALGIEVP